MRATYSTNDNQLFAPLGPSRAYRTTPTSTPPAPSDDDFADTLPGPWQQPANGCELQLTHENVLYQELEHRLYGMVGELTQLQLEQPDAPPLKRLQRAALECTHLVDCLHQQDTKFLSSANATVQPVRTTTARK
jgi:hypothetical protein